MSMRVDKKTQPAAFGDSGHVASSSGNELIKIQVCQNLQISMLPDNSHQFLISTKEVANGLGVSSNTIRTHAYNKKSEIKEGIHFLKGIVNNKAMPKSVYWTKEGVLMVASFIRTERAMVFKKWLSDLDINNPSSIQELPASTSQKHNRLSEARLLDILKDVGLIKDHKLRDRITRKLTKGGTHE